MPTKRVLWLYNHSTLIKSEVPILRELGYEVYIPKIPPFDVSIAVDWESDNLLSIPKEDISILNKVDYYNNMIPDDAMNIMNEYFDIAIFGIFVKPFISLVSKYKGILLFHPFGLEDGNSYTKILELYAGPWLLKTVEKLGYRFWFGQSYENLNEIECDFFKNRSIDLPIGMKDVTVNDRWTGKNKKMLFICPRIKINPYYEKLYKTFIDDFKDVPYSIGGAQPISVGNDPRVLGFLPQKEYDELYPSHSVMYYHSREQRHIHYHPFEAIKCGLPLIYMSGGLLDKLGGEKLPGRCKTVKEAKHKCMRIINGDVKYANKVRKSQTVLLEKMSYQYCLDKWKEALQYIETHSSDSLFEKKRKKLAIVMPAPYEGGLLDYTVNLIDIIRSGMKQSHDEIDLVFAYPKEIENNNFEIFEDLRKKDVSLRTFYWEVVDSNRVKKMAQLSSVPITYYGQQYALMNDGINYFEDCDFLLFMADRIPSKGFLMKPYGIIIHDYIQRYVSEMYQSYYEKENIDFVRESQCLFTTSKSTQLDCIQYVGVCKDKVQLVPLFFKSITDIRENEVAKKKNKYFLWSTNISIHKNHLIALKALNEYYVNGGQFDCYVTGVLTQYFDIKISLDNKNLTEYQITYLTQCREYINNHKDLKRHIHFYGNLPKSQYYKLLSNAKFVFHPGYGDNGNGSAVDGAFFKVPTLSSDYPAMRDLSNTLKLETIFFDRRNVNEMCATILWAEKNYRELRGKLPDACELKTHTPENQKLCKQVYDTIKYYAQL